MTAPVDKSIFNWAEHWRLAQAERRCADDRDYWNNRAKSFYKQCGISNYAKEFIELSQLVPEDTIFDMGCGSGALAIPLAQKGHQVFAADFSSVMLEYLNKDASEKGLSNLISSKELSWDEDWDAAEIPTCDVVIASRSIVTSDLEACLLKMEAHAKRRCCVTLATGDSPRYEPVLYQALGRSLMIGGDYIYAMNILWQLGRQPELSYIRTNKFDRYESKEEAYERIRGGFKELTPTEEVALESFFEQHVKCYIDEDGNQLWGRDYPIQADWAFISWTPPLQENNRG